MAELIKVTIADQTAVVVGGTAEQIDFAKESFTGREGLSVDELSDLRADYFGGEKKATGQQISLKTAIGKLDFELETVTPRSTKKDPADWRLLTYLTQILRYRVRQQQINESAERDTSSPSEA